MEAKDLNIFQRAWMASYPQLGVELTDKERNALDRKGIQEGGLWCLSGQLAIVGVEACHRPPVDGEDVSLVHLVSCVGIHEDLETIEWAYLSPSQARAVARALNRAARVAEGKA